MIIPVKKKLNNTGHIDAKLIDFSEICQKKSNEIGCFLPIVSWRSFPRNFPWDRPIFLTICPWKFLEIWLCSAKIPRNRPIFLRILTFLRRKSREIGPFFREFAPENPAKFCSFFREISEALFICPTPTDPQNFIISLLAELAWYRPFITQADSACLKNNDN